MPVMGKFFFIILSMLNHILPVVVSNNIYIPVNVRYKDKNHVRKFLTSHKINEYRASSSRKEIKLTNFVYKENRDLVSAL